MSSCSDKSCNSCKIDYAYESSRHLDAENNIESRQGYFTPRPWACINEFRKSGALRKLEEHDRLLGYQLGSRRLLAGFHYASGWENTDCMDVSLRDWIFAKLFIDF